MSVETFRRNIIDCGYVLDPEGIHHEFASGMHGRKQDFDSIDENDPLYSEWIDVAADFIREQFPHLPQVIIGVAKGANRTALDTARRFEGEILGLTSIKDPNNPKKLYLTSMAGQVIEALKPELVVVHEDVGTTGLNSGQVATACRDAGAQNVEVVITWMRRPVLERLEEAGIPYRAIIDEELPTYVPEDCQDHGYCSKGWELIGHSKSS
jgi:orotate phosphoribosyltransferase